MASLSMVKESNVAELRSQLEKVAGRQSPGGETTEEEIEVEVESSSVQEPSPQPSASDKVKIKAKNAKYHPCTKRKTLQHFPNPLRKSFRPIPQIKKAKVNIAR
jgi:hypothetical protein